MEDDPLEGIPMTNYAVDYATGEVGTSFQVLYCLV